MSDEEHLEIRQPEGVVSITWALYVHGVGFNIRAIGVPASDPDQFLQFLEDEGLRCSNSRPGLWIIQGLFPDQEPGVIRQHVTSNMHEVAEILGNPKLIRLMAAEDYAQAPLVPLNPVTRDGHASVDEFNNWVEHNLGMSERKDFSMLSDVSFDGFEDMLRQAAEGVHDGSDETD